MKSLKLLMMAAALGVAFVIPTQAADAKAPSTEGRKGGGGRGQMNPEAQVTRLDEAVTLTADQKTKVLAIYTKQQEQMQAMRGGGGGQEANREKMQELMRTTRDQVRALLTTEQQTKFDAMPQGRGQGGQGKGGGQGRKKAN